MADREEEAAAAAVEEHEGSTVAAGDEEDTGAQVAPIVRLEEVTVSTGEENEDALLELKAKLYRFDPDGKQWKERGVGVAKILKHKDNNKARILMRQNKTLKICANHYLTNNMNLQEHSGSDKSWVWHAADFSDGQLKNELLCIRFGSVENARMFKDTFEESAEGVPEATETAIATQAAELLDNLSVSKEAENKPAADSDAAAASPAAPVAASQE